MPTRDELLDKALAQITPIRYTPAARVFPGYAAEEAASAYGSSSALQKAFTPGLSDLEELALALAALETATASHQVYVDSVWRRIYKALSIPAGESFPSDGIPDARDFLFLRLALARADAYLPRHIAVQRSRAYRICHDIASRWGLEEQMRRHMLSRWGVRSMRELENEHLYSLEDQMLHLENRHERQTG